MNLFVTFGALFCFMGVVAGALGAHALKGLLDQLGGTANYLLATEYMFYHGLGLIAVGIVKGRGHSIFIELAGWLFVAGSILFQGNLYLISLAELRTFQSLTPIGGICLMAAWLALGLAAVRRKPI